MGGSRKPTFTFTREGKCSFTKSDEGRFGRGSARPNRLGMDAATHERRCWDADSPEKVFNQSDSEEEDQGVSEEKDPTEETIRRTGRLFVRNLTFACTEEELLAMFQPFGAVSQVREFTSNGLNCPVGEVRCKYWISRSRLWSS